MKPTLSFKPTSLQILHGDKALSKAEASSPPDIGSIDSKRNAQPQGNPRVGPATHHTHRVIRVPNVRRPVPARQTAHAAHTQGSSDSHVASVQARLPRIPTERDGLTLRPDSKANLTQHASAIPVQPQTWRAADFEDIEVEDSDERPQQGGTLDQESTRDQKGEETAETKWSVPHARKSSPGPQPASSGPADSSCSLSVEIPSDDDLGMTNDNLAPASTERKSSLGAGVRSPGHTEEIRASQAFDRSKLKAILEELDQAAEALLAAQQDGQSPAALKPLAINYLKLQASFPALAQVNPEYARREHRFLEVVEPALEKCAESDRLWIEPQSRDKHLRAQKMLQDIADIHARTFGYPALRIYYDPKMGSPWIDTRPPNTLVVGAARARKRMRMCEDVVRDLVTELAILQLNFATRQSASEDPIASLLETLRRVPLSHDFLVNKVGLSPQDARRAVDSSPQVRHVDGIAQATCEVLYGTAAFKKAMPPLSYLVIPKRTRPGGPQKLTQSSDSLALGVARLADPVKAAAVAPSMEDAE